MGSKKIGLTWFNLDALKGMTKTAFLKGGSYHTVDAWDALQEYLPQPKKKEIIKEEEEDKKKAEKEKVEEK